ncbi:hypothetical protein CY35_09G062400 [Sphagnum magellanicum]|nr:hypothetical protein CY35_09G062400 [Sphagnum magellanicum]
MKNVLTILEGDQLDELLRCSGVGFMCLLHYSSQEISDDMWSSARAVQAAKAGIQCMGALATLQTTCPQQKHLCDCCWSCSVQLSFSTYMKVWCNFV